ncbi:MAG TPA: hypothetical protein DCY13_06470 [Verrucomicrobiales bacterium]|nr:hypothetical protein [Verrucomicrobiales bacterium]
MAGFALLAVSLPLLFWFRLDYYEACARCARKREVQEWLIPFTRIAYYEYRQEMETPLSPVLAELGYVDPHDHDWLIIHGTGPGTEELMGEGFPLAQSLVTASMGRFVRLLDQHLEEEEVGYWFARMSDPQHAYVVRNIADQIVQESYADAAAFRARLEKVGAHERALHRYRMGLLIDEPEARTPPRLLYERSPR